VPAPKSGKGKRGRPVVIDRRSLLNAIFHVVRSGCAWRLLPSDFGPWQTVYACALRVVASPFYEYKIIAKSGDTLDGFPAQSVKRAVSLNDNGRIAFIGESAAGTVSAGGDAQLPTLLASR
jgi:hypothetical protein